MHFKEILQHYNLPTNTVITPITNGLINHTYLLTSLSNKKFVLQKINTSVFTNPNLLSENLTVLNSFLQKEHPNYLIASPVLMPNGAIMLQVEKSFYRLFNYMENSITNTVVANTNQAFEAAVSFGKFTSLFKNFTPTSLHYTIPNFHHLGLRFKQFETALRDGNTERIKNSKKEIDYIIANKNIASQYEAILSNKDFITRVTHHDTKISNVLFDKNDKALCVIDLDTTMPGHFISDVGDMFRTYLSAVSEEEADLSKVTLRPDYFQAIKEGYLSQMQSFLTAIEIANFNYSGAFMLYMQSIRFLTDYINNDIYYQVNYTDHNLVRAKNQIALLQQYLLYIK